MAEEYQHEVYECQDMCMRSHLYFPLLLQMKCPLQYYQNKYKINEHCVSSIQSQTEVTTESSSFTLLETQRLFDSVSYIVYINGCQLVSLRDFKVDSRKIYLEESV